MMMPTSIPVESWEAFLRQVDAMRAMQIRHRALMLPFMRKDVELAEALVDATVERFSFAIRCAQIAAAEAAAEPCDEPAIVEGGAA